MTSSELFIVNPDVSCREEEPEGAILFNPDTDDVLVINTTGFLVWEALSEPRTEEQLAEVLAARCDKVPQDQVGEHVAAFIKPLIEKGFVSVYQEQPG